MTTALDLGMKAAPIVGIKAIQAGRYYASEAMRNPKLQQKVIDYALVKSKPILNKVGIEALTQLSTSIRPPKRKDGKQMHKTDIKGLDYDGAGLVDSLLEQANLAKRLSAVPQGAKLLKEALNGGEMNKEDAEKLVAEYKRQYEEYKSKGGKKSYNKWILDMGYGKRAKFGPCGGAVDIHKAIGKLPKPKGGWTLPGHKYTGPYNNLDSQVRYNPVTGEILEIYDKPTGKTDEIAMQHDIDYSVCKDDKKCKNEADRQMVKALDQIPYKDRQWGHWLERNMINSKQKLGLGVKQRKSKKRKAALSNDDWAQHLADKLHKPIRRKFKTRRVIVNHIDEIWSADLVFMDKLSKWNKGFKYILTLIDVFSKFAWVLPLKDKKGISVTNAFNTIVKNSNRKPKFLWVDKGSEFYNKTFKEWLKQNNIDMYSTFNEGKAVVLERFNRTLKTKMYKQFTIQNNTIWYNILDKLVREYNSTKHSSMKMTPVEASKKKNEGAVYFNLYGDMEISTEQKPKFKKGDKVRVSKYKRKTFDKGYTPNWSEEIFTIDKIQYKNPITYKLKDLNDEEIKGSFYEKEILRTKQNVFRIEKVIKRDYKKKQALVKWRGYDNSFNSWIPFKDLVDS